MLGGFYSSSLLGKWFSKVTAVELEWVEVVRGQGFLYCHGHTGSLRVWLNAAPAVAACGAGPQGCQGGWSWTTLSLWTLESPAFLAQGGGIYLVKP